MGKKLDLLGRRLSFVGDLAYGLVDLVAFRITRKLSGNPQPPETLDDIAEDINSGELFVPVYAADLCRQSSYALSENGKLYLDGRMLDSFAQAPIRDKNTALLNSLIEDKEGCVDISQKMAQRIAKAAQREGLDVPPYVQYRATRSDGKIAKYAQSAAKYAAMALSWFVVGAGLALHLVEFYKIQPITDSCKPTVSPDQKNALCHEWNQEKQTVSVWRKKLVGLNESVPFYAPPFSYDCTQRIPYSDVPNHPQAVEALTAYAVRSGCPTASSQKLQQTFNIISETPADSGFKKELASHFVKRIVLDPKAACRVM